MSCHTPTAVPCPPPSCSRTSPPAAPRSMTAPSTVRSSRTRSSSSSHSSQRHQPHSCLRSCSATTPHTPGPVVQILPRPLPRAKSALPLQQHHHGRGGGLSYPSKQPQPHTVSMRRSQSSSQAAALRCPPRCGGGKSSSLVHSLWTPLWSCVKPGRAGPPVLEQPDASLGAASTLTSLPTTLEPDAVVSSTPPPPHRVERDEEVEEEEEEEDDLALVCSTSGGRGGSLYVTPCSTTTTTTTSTNHASSTGHHPVILHDLRPPGRQAPFQFATTHAPPHFYGMPPQYASVVPQPFVLTNLSSSFDGSDTSGSSSSSSSSAAANRYPPLPIWQPNSNDVLCGRGGGSGNPHLGNARFRQLIASQQDYYHSLTTKKQKLALARLMVDLIRGVGGRFLARGDHPSAIAAGMTSASPYSGGTTGWYDIGMARSIEKTSQAFRETAATKPAKAPSGDGKVNSKLPKTTPASTTRATATTTTNAPSLMDAMALTESSGSSSTEEPSLSTNSSTLSEQDDGEEIPGLDVSASTVTASTSASHSCAMSTFSTTCSEVTTKMHNRNTGSTVAFYNNKNNNNKPYAKMLSQLRKLPSDLLQLYGPAVKQLMDDPPGPSPRQQQPQHAMAQPFVRPAPPMPTHDFYYRGGGDPHRSRTMTTAPHPMQRNNSTPTPVPPALASPAPLVRPASSLIPNHPSLVPPTSQKPQNQPLGMAYPMPTKNTQRTSPHPLQQEKSPWGFMNKSSSSSKTSRPSATSPKSSIHDSTPSISPTRQQVWKRPRTHGDATADGSATKGEPVANLIPAALSQTDESSNSSDSAYTDDPYDYTYKYSNDFPAAPTFSSLTSASFGPNSNNNNNSHLESKLSLPDRVIRAPSSGSSHSSNSSTSTPTLLPPNRVVGRQPHCRSPSKSPHRTGSSVEYREEDSGAGEMAALSTTEFLQLDKVVE